MSRRDASRSESIPRPYLSHDTAVQKPLIGWREWVGLPELGLPYLEAKIDTGARSSSLDATLIEEFQRSRTRWLRFACFSDADLSQRGEIVEAKLLGYRDVRCSNGQISHRPVIETHLQIGCHSWPIEISLTNRRPMGFRLLLGRSAIVDRYAVDVARSFIWGSGT